MLKLLIFQIPRHILSPSCYMCSSIDSSRSFIQPLYRTYLNPSHPSLSNTNLYFLHQQYHLHETRLLFPDRSLVHFICSSFGGGIIHSKKMCLGVFCCKPQWSGDRKWPFLWPALKNPTGLTSNVWDVFRHSEWDDIRTSGSWNVGSDSVKCQWFDGCFWWMPLMWTIWKCFCFYIRYRTHEQWHVVAIYKTQNSVNRNVFMQQKRAAENNYISSWNKHASIPSGFFPSQRMALNALRHHNVGSFHWRSESIYPFSNVKLILTCFIWSHVVCAGKLPHVFIVYD